MLQTSLHREELEVTLKRERRMAEKSLARSKKMVCFNCRQPGEVRLQQKPNYERKIDYVMFMVTMNLAS